MRNPSSERFQKLLGQRCLENLQPWSHLGVYELDFLGSQLLFPSIFSGLSKSTSKVLTCGQNSKYRVPKGQRFKSIYPQEAMESFAFPGKTKMTSFIPFIFVNPLFYGQLHIVCCVIVRWLQKSPLYFPSIILLRGIGSRWNPAKIDARTPLYLPRCHLSGLIHQIRRYVVTTKGCQTQYLKSRGLQIQQICKG